MNKTERQQARSLVAEVRSWIKSSQAAYALRTSAEDAVAQDVEYLRQTSALLSSSDGEGSFEVISARRPDAPADTEPRATGQRVRPRRAARRA